MSTLLRALQLNSTPLKIQYIIDHQGTSLILHILLPSYQYYTTLFETMNWDGFGFPFLIFLCAHRPWNVWWIMSLTNWSNIYTHIWCVCVVVVVVHVTFGTNHICGKRMTRCTIVQYILTEQGLSGLLVGALVCWCGERSASSLMDFSTICCCDGLFVIVTLTLSRVCSHVFMWHSLHYDVEDY